MRRPWIIPSLSGILAVFALSSCLEGGEGECADRHCSALYYSVVFRDGAWNLIDTLKADSARIEVMGQAVASLGKIASEAECVACSESFQNSRLVSDREIRTGAGETIPAGTNLLAPQVIGKVGQGNASALDLFRATRLSRGRNSFAFQGSIDGESIMASGSVWVPDSLGF